MNIIGECCIIFSEHAEVEEIETIKSLKNLRIKRRSIVSYSINQFIIVGPLLEHQSDVSKALH